VQPALAGFHHKTNHCPLAFPPAKLIKMSIRANPLAFVLCGVCSNSLADELEHIYRRNFLEFIKEWVTHLAKTTLMAYALCILILFGTPFVKSML
jgi:hypothetical protein